MKLVDRILLLGTGLIALYLVWRFTHDGPQLHDLYYATSFSVLLVAGLLLIGFGYGVLESPLVAIVAALIPTALAAGLVREFFPGYARPYTTFAVSGVLAIAITRLTGPRGLATVVLAVVHAIAGLTIFALPVVVIWQSGAPGAFAFVTVGGTLIGLGGLALAFLKAGRPILPARFIFTILAPLLLLMTASLAWGFIGKGG